MSTKPEKCYDPLDTTLRFTGKEDELDFLCEGFRSRTALMSCGHAVTPMSLTNWCRRQLDQGKHRFVCGLLGCGAEWSYAEVRKMALLTQEEMKYFENAMAFNAPRNKPPSKPCPGCQSAVVRVSESNLSVRCTVCSAKKGRIYEFCWQCLREWKGPRPRSDRCDNDGCCNESLKTLKICPETIFESMPELTGCPSIRACPTCGILLQHSKKHCRIIVCPQCKVQFCFVCLRAGNYHVKCSRGVAPRQTSIPVWQKK